VELSLWGVNVDSLIDKSIVSATESASTIHLSRPLSHQSLDSAPVHSQYLTGSTILITS
jgi:hypothetical protein